MRYNTVMNKKFAACAAAIVCAIACIPLSACAEKQEDKTLGRQLYAMGTYARLTATSSQISEKDFETLADEVSEFLYATENSVSTVVETSYIYKFNAAAAGQTVELDKTAYELLTLSKTLYEKTEGNYNPAVWYCEDLYRFAQRTQSDKEMPYDRADKSLPEEKYVTAFCQLASHFNEVKIYEKDGGYYADKPAFTVKVEGDDREYSLKLDLGGITKGWCADRVDAMYSAAGITNGYFNFGESSMALKRYAGNRTESYQLELTDPRNIGVSYGYLFAKDVKLSTSGDHLKYYVLDDVRYCHIIDPKTGSPIRTGISSATVVGGSAAEADALTTALSAMGVQKAAEFINAELSDRKVVMLVFEGEDGKIITNCPDDLTVRNSAYPIANTVVDGKIVLN